ncbi:MAG: HlyD family efflux transporter periplasmic adaptor subunit [Calditrichaeota bacterium]|nr:HlyD family efflux transporter periplasmic adaptor subunit [Calditrichota bacterium]
MNRKKLFLTLIFIAAVSTGLWQCGSSEKPVIETQDIQDHRDEERRVTMTPDEMKEFDVETATAGPAKLQIHIMLPGEVIIPPDNLAHIHPRFPGIVKEVRKTIGDKVRKGDVLAIIESNESMSDYAIKSLISGTVIEMHLTRGEMIDDSEHGFVIADLSTVWIYLQVYQKDLPYIKKGQKVIISAGKGLPDVQGTISYISPIIDEATRTAEARVVLRNSNGIWKPGLFVTGRIVTNDIYVDVAVPKTALETLDGETVVFVKDDAGFKPQPVHINRENDTLVEIVHGLKAGEVYVSNNGFILKAELMKSEFENGHGH